MGRIFIPCIGGLGQSRLGTLIIPSLRLLPGVTVWTPEDSDSQYEDDIGAAFEVSPELLMIPLGHSLGCGTVARLVEKYRSIVKYAVFIENVWVRRDVENMPCLSLHCDAAIDFPREPVTGSAVREITIPGTDHNTICDSIATVRRIRDALMQFLPTGDA